MAIREIGTGKDDDDGATENEAWGTLEELLLASAVIRYGPNCWDSVAGELQKRTATNNLYNSQACELKFDDLRRRFAVGAEADEEAVLRRMEDKLKKRRIEALKLELKGRDSSIELKESNLKKLKEAADLVCDSDKRSDSAAAVEEDEAVQASSASGEASDDRAINKPEPEKEETCELENRGITGPGLPEVEPVQTAPKPASPLSLELSDAVAKSKSKEQSHEMQSQETVKRRRNDGEDDGPKPVAAAAATATPSKALQPRTLIRILDLIRSQKNSSFFESRLPSQGGKEYKKMIKQHMDLKTVEANMNQGLYVNSESRFFRDILLVFSNFIAFFPKDSPEYVAAQEIQKIVIKEANPTQPKSAKIQLARVSADNNKEANPLIICRRRSSAYPTEPLEAKSKPKDSHQAAEAAAAAINKKDTEKTGKPPLSRKKDVEEKHEGKGNEGRSKTSQRTTKNMVRKRNREEESPEDGEKGEDFKTRVKRGKRADNIRVVDKQPQTKVTKEDTTLSRNNQERKYIVLEQNISGDKKRGKVEEKKASKGDNNVGQRKDSEKEASGSVSRVKTAERNCKAVVAKFKERKNIAAKEEEKDKAASNPKFDKNVCVIETDDEEEELVNKVKRTGKPPPKSDYFRRMKVVMESSSEEEEEEEDRERDRRNHNELGKVAAAAAQRERREEKSNDTRRGGDSSSGSRRRGRPRKSSLPPPTGRDSRRGVKRRPEEEEEEEEEDLPPSRKRGRR